MSGRKLRTFRRRLRMRRACNWRALALELYRRMYGRRCLKCSQIVTAKDAALYRLSGRGGELLLVHERCKP